MSKRAKWMTCWVPHRLEMLMSPAWKARPIAVMHLLERLEIEHLRHGGVCNGELFVSHRQFTEAGVAKRVIARAIICAIDLGLLEALESPPSHGYIRPPGRYRLTYLPVGKSQPTDEWKRVNNARADRVAADFRAATRPRACGLESERVLA